MEHIWRIIPDGEFIRYSLKVRIGDKTYQQDKLVNKAELPDSHERICVGMAATLMRRISYTLITVPQGTI